ncbi:kinase-associated lipoprotein B [Bacillus weihaiensis]|uniref:Kinase n=1 Tax=Bacillus weihaiensis TaxID=1547283 RepID=A0A1L3MNR6_9BACI|nr:kinase-associated lipoprotein B [Bacillus weihaiensis]APH03874.1 kinase [Bacillus weihaiensis]
MMQERKVGEIVTGIYKTGKYIGEITDVKPAHYLVKVKAVLNHPQQGDLHNPKQVDVQFFHERRALAYQEQTNIPKQMVKEYHDEVPVYADSLKLALKTMKAKLEADATPWAQASLEKLAELEKDYFPTL